MKTRLREMFSAFTLLLVLGTYLAYFDRFVFSQKFAQVDPWSERVSGKDKHEFKPMATIQYNQAAE